MLVQIQEGHVAPGASAQPRGSQFGFGVYAIHCFFSRAVTMYCRKCRSLRISATVLPFEKSAPVGHTWTHLPHPVQFVDSPQGSPRSAMTLELRPRPATSQT